MKRTIILLICLLFLCSCGKKKSNDNKCKELKDWEYKITFYSNGGTEFEEIKMCEKCERPEIDLLPVPTKKNYIFGGWYYDEVFLSKADVKTVDELELKRYQDKKGCDIKIKDINLYALWIEK